ncbi:hypothetical protein GCM10023168_25400 [Fodinibacter luteus]|uniref:Uncharacterized protein n=1 Tax=Fodinibacter luteus TaxID=552064 RepID=A0ABP8KK38_9MICO
MSTHVIPAGRHRASAIVILVALVAAIAVAVLAVVDAPPTGASQQGTTAPGAVPTPDWLQRYLDVEAPVDADAPVATGVRPVNEGLR